MSHWDTYAVCTGCDTKYRASFGDTFFLHFECCPICGEDKDKWPVHVMRYVPTGELFKPSTWGTGHWETKHSGMSSQESGA